MANEATVTCSVQITKGNLQYRSYPTQFNADVAGQKGPTPGSIQATVAGVDVDLSGLTQPGLCVIQNQSDSGVVDVGIWDDNEFHPLMELLPGEIYPLRLSRNLTTSFGTGTGTTDTGKTLRVKGQTGNVDVFIGAFEV